MPLIRRYVDWLACALLILITLAYAASFVNFNVPPYEDAAMLMRYADHLAHGHGIVWNIGEHPVDGATDFLFMAVSAGLIRIGVPVGRSVRLIGFFSHLLTVLDRLLGQPADLERQPGAGILKRPLSQRWYRVILRGGIFRDAVLRIICRGYLGVWLAAH